MMKKLLALSLLTMTFAAMPAVAHEEDPNENTTPGECDVIAGTGTPVGSVGFTVLGNNFGSCTLVETSTLEDAVTIIDFEVTDGCTLFANTDTSDDTGTTTFDYEVTADDIHTDEDTGTEFDSDVGFAMFCDIGVVAGSGSITLDLAEDHTGLTHVDDI